MTRDPSDHAAATIPRWDNFAARKTRQLPQFAYTGPELNLGVIAEGTTGGSIGPPWYLMYDATVPRQVESAVCWATLSILWSHSLVPWTFAEWSNISTGQYHPDKYSQFLYLNCNFPCAVEALTGAWPISLRLGFEQRLWRHQCPGPMWGASSLCGMCKVVILDEGRMRCEEFACS